MITMGYILHTLLVFIIIQGYVQCAQLPNNDGPVEPKLSSDQERVAKTPESLEPSGDVFSQDQQVDALEEDEEIGQDHSNKTALQPQYLSESFNSRFHQPLYFENDDWEECKFGMQLRCRGNGLAMTCDRVLNEETNTYEHQCLSGEGYDVFDDMACCKPCCYRSDPTDVHKRCADIDYEDLTCPRDIDDCLTLRMKGETRSGVYKVFQGSSMEEVYCDMETDGGGWTVIQSRVDGSVDFDRNWEEYEEGFGDPRSNYWMGLKRMHALTAATVELYVYLQRFSGRSAYAKYSSFSISDATTQYMMQLSGYSGTAGSSLHSHHNYMQFTTKDRDNDKCSCNCAVRHPSGWWYNNCFQSSLNGYYFPRETESFDGIVHRSFLNRHTLYKVKMMIRPYK